MKKIILTIAIIITPFVAKSQELDIVRTTNWSTLRKSGFYESTSNENALNAPNGSSVWYYGINVGHYTNPLNPGAPFHSGGQFAFATSDSPTKIPELYIRSTNREGLGIWSKVLHDQGTQTINGSLSLATIHDGGLRIGKKDVGNENVLYGAVATQLNIDFPGYRDVEPDFVGARIACLRFNIYEDNKAFMQNAGLAFYTSPYAGPSLVERMRITPQGNIGIGTAKPEATLDVNGSIRASILNVAGEVNARTVNIKVDAGADFVFEPSYTLKPLSELETFVKENKHLPDIPTEKHMVENGLNVNDMQIKLLQKIEELTLYTIEQQKQLNEQSRQIKELQEKLIQNQ